MSHSFTVPLSEPPDLLAVIEALDVDDLEVEGELPVAGTWPEGTYLHLYRRGISCRSVELGFDADGLQVRVFSCSSADDVVLALALVHEVARRHGVFVQDEYGDEVPVDQLDTHYAGFPEDYATWGAEFLPRMLDGPDVKGLVTLPGPGRPFVVGPRLIKALRPSSEGYVERFYERQRTVRWYDPEGWWFHAEPMLLEREDGVQLRLAALGPGVRYLMPDVNGFALHTDGAPLFIPADQLVQMVDVEWLDEGQFLLEAIPEGQWGAFLEVAAPRCRAIEDFG